MRRASRFVVALSVAVLGVGLAAMVGIAVAASPTLGVNKSTVTNFNTHQSTNGVRIVTAKGGFAVYTLTGDSKSHPKCLSKGCKAIWPWVTIASGKTPTKNSMIKAQLGVWKHNGVRQLTLGGHPLYFYAGDSNKLHANGEGIVSFGGTWHVWKVSSTSSSSTSSSPTTTMPTSSPMPMPMPSPNPNPYP
jgi:predicted lipoprotein with Yx(FWY)xxD motif